MEIRKIERPAPVPVIEMTFTKEEGWAVLAALKEFVQDHPFAIERDKWFAWAERLAVILENLPD